AEDGIRDDLVTGVQTCALPIYLRTFSIVAADRQELGSDRDPALAGGRVGRDDGKRAEILHPEQAYPVIRVAIMKHSSPALSSREIGRASCRERVEVASR